MGNEKIGPSEERFIDQDSDEFHKAEVEKNETQKAVPKDYLEEATEPKKKEGLSGLVLLNMKEAPTMTDLNTLVIDALKELKASDVGTFEEFKHIFLEKVAFLKESKKRPLAADFETDLVFLSSTEVQEELAALLQEYLSWLNGDYDMSSSGFSLRILESLQKNGNLQQFLDLKDASRMTYLGVGLFNQLQDQSLSKNIRLLTINLIAEAGIMSVAPVITDGKPSEQSIDAVIALAFAKSVFDIVSSSMIEESLESIGLMSNKGEMKKAISFALLSSAINRIGMALKMPELMKQVLGACSEEFKNLASNDLLSKKCERLFEPARLNLEAVLTSFGISDARDVSTNVFSSPSAWIGELEFKQSLYAALLLSGQTEEKAHEFILTFNMNMLIPALSVQEMELETIASKGMINLFAIPMPLNQTPVMNDKDFSVNQTVSKRSGVLEKKIEDALIREGEGRQSALWIAHNAAINTLNFSGDFIDEEMFRKTLFSSLVFALSHSQERSNEDIQNLSQKVAGSILITSMIQKEILENDFEKILENSHYSHEKAQGHALAMANSIFRTPELFKNKDVFVKGVIDTFVSFGLVDRVAVEERVAPMEFGLVISPVSHDELTQEFIKKASGLIDSNVLNGLINLLFKNGKIIDSISETINGLEFNEVLLDFAHAVANPSLEYYTFLKKATGPSIALASTLFETEQKKAEINRTLNIGV